MYEIDKANVPDALIEEYFPEQEGDRHEEALSKIRSALCDKRNDPSGIELLVVWGEDVDKVPDAALSYREREKDLFVLRVGALRQGLGKILLAQVAEEALQQQKKVALKCPEEAWEYYENLGFRHVSIIRVNKEYNLRGCLLEGKALQTLAKAPSSLDKALKVKKCVREKAQEFIRNAIKDDSVETLFEGVSRNVSAALSYTEHDHHFFIEGIGSLKKGDGRKLLARLAHIAREKNKSHLVLESGSGVVSYYERLGFELFSERDPKRKMILDREGIEKLAQEYIPE